MKSMPVARGVAERSMSWTAPLWVLSALTATVAATLSPNTGSSSSSGRSVLAASEGQERGASSFAGASLELSAAGAIIRHQGQRARRQEEADVARNHVDSHDPETPSAEAAGTNILSDGSVEVVAPAESESEQVKLRELTEECLQEEPTAECMQKFGSYGVRRLFTEDYRNLRKLGLMRPGWMSHPTVQKKRLFDLTLPGSSRAGTYAFAGVDGLPESNTPYGIVSQNLNVYQQLEVGIRALDIAVSWNEVAGLVYVSHGVFMMPLSVILRDIRRFLEEHEREVVVLNVHKDEDAPPSKIEPFNREEQAPDRVPGQLVHEAVECELKDFVATHAVLSKLPLKESGDNPVIGHLTDIGAHVIYFWDSQQVLCTTFETCKITPGWFPTDKWSGHPFAFGQPFKLGARANATGSKASARIFEPACWKDSYRYTKDDSPEQLLKKVKTYIDTIRERTAEERPACFPVRIEIPELHSPTIFQAVDGFVIPTPEEKSVQVERMRGVKAIYTRGEGFTVKTEAERTNYLMLNWLMKKDNQAVYSKPNAIFFEFVGSAAAPVVRIIEENQGRPECSYALYCKDSGSCWADTLLIDEDKCEKEEKALRRLKAHADGEVVYYAWIVWLTLGCAIWCLVTVLGRWSYWAYQNLQPPKEGEIMPGEDPEDSEEDQGPPKVPKHRDSSSPQGREGARASVHSEVL